VPSEPEEFRIPLPELTVAAKRWGASSEAVPRARVLAVHGWLDNANSFDAVSPGMEDFELVALDLPGHGRSEHRVHGPYHFIDQVADVIAAADALGWRRFSFLGHSLGGSIGAIVAGTLPERIESLIMIESLGPLTETVEGSPKRLARSLEVEAKKRTRKKRVYPSHEAAAEQVVLATAMHEASALRLVQRGLERSGDGWVWSADPRLRVNSRLRLTEAQVHAFLAGIRCPSLLITATKGYTGDASLLRARFERFESIERVELPGGHHVHLDAAAEVVPHLRRFILDATSGAP
jgi:pimeloyl-ACP methyl ester carboxylesterase